MPKSPRQPVFSDKVVTTTELARRVKEITQGALRQPVTIHRPEGDLALLSRAEVAEMIAATTASEALLEFARNLVGLLKGANEPLREWEWLRVFSVEDVADFLDEYVTAIEQAMEGRAGWTGVGDVIYEWQETARAMNHQPLLGEVALARGLVSEAEVAQLSAAELRRRLYAALERKATSGE